jgi:hypothetical protein
MIFRLAKILGPKKLRQTNDLRTLFCRIANEIDGAGKILFRFWPAPHLNERDLCHLSHPELTTKDTKTTKI